MNRHDPAKGESNKRSTSSGVPIEPLYEALPDDFDAERDLGRPGEYPYTRGPYPGMYTSRLWTMRQYAGFASAAESNKRYRYLLSQGQTGLSVAFDLVTQIGFDPDHELAEGEVGKTGVSIVGLWDMERLFEGIPLDQVSVSMTINATAATLLALLVAVADKQGVPREKVTGTIQNDILKEFVARGTYIYPPGPSMRLVADTFRFCRDELPKFNPISISGYHVREAGCTAAEEIALTLGNGIAYVKAALDAGLQVDEFAPRLSFFFNSHSNLFEEVAKFRAARRIWARIMKERFGAQKPNSLRLRFHTQTAGSTLTAQQPTVNIPRVTLQALAAVLGGTQSLHTNAYDEALALPTEESARLALRTQQVIGYESGVTDTVDPLAGSYFIESLTDELDNRAGKILDEIDALGGAVAAIEKDYYLKRIESSALAAQRAIERSDQVVVGVNRFEVDDDTHPRLHPGTDPAFGREQIDRLNAERAKRDSDVATRALAALKTAADSDDAPLMPCILDAVKARCSLGEVADALRAVWGEYRPHRAS